MENARTKTVQSSNKSATWEFINWNVLKNQLISVKIDRLQDVKSRISACLVFELEAF